MRILRILEQKRRIISFWIFQAELDRPNEKKIVFEVLMQKIFLLLAHVFLVFALKCAAGEIRTFALLLLIFKGFTDCSLHFITSQINGFSRWTLTNKN